MAYFIATLAAERLTNWPICKAHAKWGIIGRGSNWRSNAARVRAGDRIFIWQGGHPNGFIAQIEALGPIQLPGSPDFEVPWPEPEAFGATFPMAVVHEIHPPVGDSFSAPGRVGRRFGFNNTALQHNIEQLNDDLAVRIASVFPGEPTQVGVPYVDAPPPAPVKYAEPFDVDPDAVDRGLLAHHRTVDALARWVSSRGLSPRLPAAGDPRFDLAWIDRGTIIVAEVKSTTRENEESQLRLGLGQVLRYRHLLGRTGTEVRAWLVAEHFPTDGTWPATCNDAGVELVSPDRWPEGPIATRRPEGAPAN